MSKNSKLNLSLSAAALAIAFTTGCFYLAESISGENQLLNSIKVLGFCPALPSASSIPAATPSLGQNGQNGANGTDGTNGVDGADGEDGADGADGAAGICTDPITLSAIEGDLVPAVDNGYSLGTPQFRWKSLQLGPGTLYIEDITTHDQVGLTVDDGTLLLDGAQSFQVGNIRLTASGLKSILAGQDITIGNPGDTGFLSLANGIKFPDGTTVTSAAGLIGPTGPVGLTGPQGLTGLTGAQGPQGITGAQGPAGPSGGMGAFGSFFDTTIQRNPVRDGTNIITFDRQNEAQGISIEHGSRITFAKAGTYDVQFSAQADKTDSGNDDFEIWLSKNGQDIEYSNTAVTINGNNAKVAAAWNFFVTVEAGDFVELNWASDDVDLRLFSQPAGARPGIPSVILTVNQVQ